MQEPELLLLEMGWAGGPAGVDNRVRWLATQSGGRGTAHYAGVSFPWAVFGLH